MGNIKIALANGVARIAAGACYRARIEALLGRADGEMLADLWRAVFPLPATELPDRQAVIQDLADFAEVLQPRLADMQAEQLCWLIEKYAAQRRRSRSLVRNLIGGAVVDWTPPVSARSASATLAAT
jgi:hypothetical protein